MQQNKKFNESILKFQKKVYVSLSGSVKLFQWVIKQKICDVGHVN